MQVYARLGCGFLEAVYQDALAIESVYQDVLFQREVALPILLQKVQRHYNQ